MSESEKIVAKGKRAATLASDPVLLEALADIRRKAMDTIMASTPEQKDKREACYFSLMAVQELEIALGKIKHDGEFEAHKAKR